MRVSRNDNLIRRRSRLGTYTTFAGLAVLIAGMIASFQVRYLWVSMGALLVGFLLSQIGSYNLRRWSRNPRPDQVVEREMKGFDDRYHLYAWALPAPHVLLSPQGVYSFEVRDQTGQVSVNGDQWRSRFSLGRSLLLFGQEGLGNPGRDAREGASRVQKLIDSQLPESQARVQPVVVFLDPRVKLEINEPAVPVLMADDLKRWLRGAGKGDMLKSADYRALEQLFDAAAGDVTIGDAKEEKKTAVKKPIKKYPRLQRRRTRPGATTPPGKK